jgi:hypothetical protein
MAGEKASSCVSQSMNRREGVIAMALDAIEIAAERKACFLSVLWQFPVRFNELAVATKAPWAANKIVNAVSKIAGLPFKF